MANVTIDHCGWYSVDSDLPDADTLVLVYCDEQSEPVWIGYLDGDDWRTAEGTVIEPTHWMPFPDTPVMLEGE